ncbi:MAG: hypothetical protein ACE1Y7_00530, partial [Lysobacteraceae bacterium]
VLDDQARESGVCLECANQRLGLDQAAQAAAAHVGCGADLAAGVDQLRRRDTRDRIKTLRKR